MAYLYKVSDGRPRTGTTWLLSRQRADFGPPCCPLLAACIRSGTAIGHHDCSTSMCGVVNVPTRFPRSNSAFLVRPS